MVMYIAVLLWSRQTKENRTSREVTKVHFRMQSLQVYCERIMPC